MHILEAGQKFERYQVIRQLGQGTAGTSYEAEDSRLKNTVVLKLIQPWSEVSYATRRQFFRDMQVLSVLTHPYLTTILNYGEVAGQLYVVRRYISNGSLLGSNGRLWLNPPLNAKDAFTYTYQLSQALHLIHSYDHTHGSLTFSNVLISKQPHAEADNAPLLLSDAGLAQFVRRFGRPQQNMLPMTAAPEQFKGQVTPASDQYALAILLYVWLTGRPPFAGLPAEIEQLKRAGNISMPDRLLTGEQEEIIRRALNARPDARYPSILAFAEALTNSLRSVPNTADSKTEVLKLQHAKMARDKSTIIPARKREQITPTEPQIVSPHPKQVLQPVLNTQTEPAAATPKPENDRNVVAPLPSTPDISQAVTDLPLVPVEPIQPQPAQKHDESPPIQETKNHDPEPQSHVATVDMPLTAQLVITSPFSQESRTVTLLKDEVTLGRAGSSDILLDEDTITSRHHAHIKRERENYVIYDKRSTYGVSVNEQKKLEEGVGHILREGDSIQIGDYHLHFSFQPLKDTNDTHIEHVLQ